MVDCELRFKCGEYDITRFLEKSFLHPDGLLKVFESKDITETKEYMKKILKGNLDIERNLGGDETMLWYELIRFLVSLEYQKLDPTLYCEIALR